jgi:hypothetical protein
MGAPSKLRLGGITSLSQLTPVPSFAAFVPAAGWQEMFAYKVAHTGEMSAQTVAESHECWPEGLHCAEGYTAQTTPVCAKSARKVAREAHRLFRITRRSAI